MKCSREKRMSYTEKANKILEQLSLEEKVFLMSGSIDFTTVRKAIRSKSNEHYNHIPYAAGGIPEKNIPAMLFCDGPRGVVCGVGKSTCFPVTMLRGATFDTKLEERIGQAMAEEVLAYNGNVFAGVCINLPYNPGWGRSQETYGEESFHLGEMGASLVRGVQEKGVIACVKHFAFNQMENSRFNVNIECSKRTEREIFLPHFKRCIDEGAASVMSSYNLYNGSYCGQNDYLLNKVLKEEWNFDGFVMSDFVWGVHDTVEAANGGLDIEMCCTKYYGNNLVNAVRENKVSEEKVNEAAIRIIRTLLAFEDSQESVKPDVIGSNDHIKLALQAAREGITLIKNENNTLPLDKKNIKRIAVIGRLARKEVIGDRGSSQVFPEYVITPIQGFANIAPELEIIYYEGSDIEHCKTLAKRADAVIFVVGYDYNDEGEYVAKDKNDVYTTGTGGDRINGLGLHQNEIKILNEVGPLNSNSIAVLIGGNMIMMSEWENSINSIIMAYYPGMEGGTALAEIIYGDVNPSGKLPFVVPMEESDLPQINWETEYQYYDYYHGYTKLDKEGIKPRLPYGFGLSYTTFNISNVNASVENNEIIGRCKIKNTGKRFGTEVVQMYIGFKNSKIDRPIKILRGFSRIDLEVNEEKIVEIKCPISELSWYNELTNKMEIEHMEYELYLGTSSDEKDLIISKFEI